MEKETKATPITHDEIRMEIEDARAIADMLRSTNPIEIDWNSLWRLSNLAYGKLTEAIELLDRHADETRKAA